MSSARLSDLELSLVLKQLLEAPLLDEEALKAFAYEGFDHKATLSALASKEPSRSTFLKEMSMLLHYVLIRGPNFEKARKTMSLTGTNQIQALVAKYNIVRSIVGQNKKDTATLSRLVALFPRMTMKILQAPGFFEKTAFARVPSTTIPTPDGGVSSDDWPESLRFPGSNCLSRDPMSPGYTAFMLAFSNVINRGKRDWERLDTMERIEEVKKWQVVTSVNPLDKLFNLEDKADTEVASSASLRSTSKASGI